MICSITTAFAVTSVLTCATATESAYPGRTWVIKTPVEAGLDAEKLRAFSEYVGGRGCVIRHGYMVYTWGDVSERADVASAAKPVYAHFLFKALEKSKIPSLDSQVVEWEPRLKNLNENLNHKDEEITWRHLANQTSCYQVVEKPGTAYCYNDWQMALFWDALFLKAYGAAHGNVDPTVMQPLLTNRLQCEDHPTFMAFGLKDRPGRLAISVRDFARFGLLYLREGNWRGEQLISQKHAETAVTSALPNSIPQAGVEVAEIIEGQRTIGSGLIPDNQTDHFGSYSWLWWINGIDRSGTRMWPDAPGSTFGAFGHGGPRAMWVMPEFGVVVSYNDAKLNGWNSGADSPTNQAMKLFTEAVVSQTNDKVTSTPSGDITPQQQQQTHISIVGNRWYLNGQVTYPGTQAEGLLMNVRMVNAVFEDRNRSDFDAEANTDQFITKIPDYTAHGIRAFTLCLQGGTPGYEGAVNSAFNPDGSLRENYLKRVLRVIDACDKHSVVVILGCYYQRQDQILKDEEAVRTGVIGVARWVTEIGRSNVVLEIANEYGHAGFDHPILKTPEGQTELIRLAKRTAPKVLVSTSGGGGGILYDEVAQVSDFLLIHYNHTSLEAIPHRITALKKHSKPVVCNEDEKVGVEGAKAAESSVVNGASWGLMEVEINQHFPFEFNGARDDLTVYAKLKELTTKR